MKFKLLCDIEGFENCIGYKIYEDGEIYSTYKKDFMRGNTDSNGYKYIDLRSCNPIIKNPKIHRLIMLAFNSNKPKEQINHIDGDKNNNHINNLEWSTNRDNRIHAIKNGLKDEINYGIAQYDLDDNLLNIFDTASEALEMLEIDGSPGNIGRVIRGSRKSAYGYVWKQH